MDRTSVEEKLMEWGGPKGLKDTHYWFHDERLMMYGGKFWTTHVIEFTTTVWWGGGQSKSNMLIQFTVTCWWDLHVCDRYSTALIIGLCTCWRDRERLALSWKPLSMVSDDMRVCLAGLFLFSLLLYCVDHSSILRMKDVCDKVSNLRFLVCRISWGTLGRKSWTTRYEDAFVAELVSLRFEEKSWR